MSAQPRSDRQPYGVQQRRGYFYGWYYLPDGKKKDGIPCYQVVDGQQAPQRLTCIKDECKDDANYIKAMAWMEQVHRGQKPLLKQVPGLLAIMDEWRDSLLARGCAAQACKDRHRALLSSVNGIAKRGRMKQGQARPIVFAGLGWKSLEQVKRGSLATWLDAYSMAGAATTTRNQMLQAWSNFIKFCIEREYLHVNPLAGIARARKNGERRPKRPFAENELRLLVEQGSENHRLFYELLAKSGLRYGEACKLRAYHLDPTGNNPRWKLTPKDHKNREYDTIPMVPSLAEKLRQRWQECGESGLLFPSPPYRRVLLDDMARLGIKRQNDRGEWLSMHSFRYSFCVQMAKFCTMREVQFLMRHKTFQLTVDLYARCQIKDESKNWILPDLTF